MTIARAKLQLTEITDTNYSAKRLKFYTQYDSTIQEDLKFQKATPTGMIELSIDKDAPVLASFAIGNYYYVDFTLISK